MPLVFGLNLPFSNGVYCELNFNALSGFNSSIIVVLSVHHFCHQIGLIQNLRFGISASEDEFHTLRFGIDELQEVREGIKP